MRKHLLSRRTLVTAAIALAVAVGSVAGTSLAQSDGSPAAKSAVAAAPGGILAGVHDALAGFVADGTITQTQADAVQAQADAGSIDPKQLVDDGVLSAAQMRTVANRIDQLKRSAG